MKLPVILDIGHSIDDFFAVALAACSPEIELLGVTTAQDNRYSRARVVRHLLDAYGRHDVPVAAGDGEGSQERLYAQFLMDGGAPLTTPDATFDHAVDFLERTLRERDDVSLAFAGPLTNLAALLRRSPNLVDRIKDAYFMGGWISQALPEHNVRLDPESVAFVLAHGVSLTALGYEVTRGHRLLRPHRDRLASSVARGPRALCHLYDTWCQAKNFGWQEILDPMVVALLCGNLNAKTEVTRVRVLTSGPGRGTMLQDHESGHEIRVVTQLDASHFIDFLVERLTPRPTPLDYGANPGRWNVHVKAAYNLTHYPGWTMTASQVDAHTLALVQEGSATASVDRRSFELSEGSALYVPPGSQLHMRSAAGIKTFWFYFYVTVRGTDRDEPLQKIPWPNLFEQRSAPDVWFSLARRIEKYWLHPWPEASLLCKAAFMELLASLHTQAHEQELRHADAAEETVLQAKRWIESRVGDPITLDEIARAVSVSKYHLLRLFREAFGITPLRYQRRLRMLHARQLLNLRHLTVGEIAKRVGYDSTSAFARAYKQEFGAAPSEERELSEVRL